MDVLKLVRIAKNDPAVRSLGLECGIGKSLAAICEALKDNTAVVLLSIDMLQSKFDRKFHCYIERIFGVFAARGTLWELEFARIYNFTDCTQSLVALIDRSPLLSSFEVGSCCVLLGFMPILRALVRNAAFCNLRMYCGAMDDLETLELIEALSNKGTMRRVVLSLGRPSSNAQPLLADAIVRMVEANSATLVGLRCDFFALDVCNLQKILATLHHRRNLETLCLYLTEAPECDLLYDFALSHIDVHVANTNDTPLALSRTANVNTSLRALFAHAPPLGTAQYTDGSGGTLAELPNELLCAIAACLYPSRSLIELAHTCRLLRDCVNDYVAWQRTGVLDWRAIYQRAGLGRE